MQKFIVDKSFWDIFPDATLGVVLIKNMNNKAENKEISKNLTNSYNKAHKHIENSLIFSENPAIKIWREAFYKFKTKKGARSSIEALLKRVEKNSPINSINPLVDIYNSISLEFGLPCGAEDLSKIEGDLILGITAGGNDFIALGEEENSPTLPGELCYYDSKGAVCRCLNWRDGKRTMIDENTTNAFLIMETIDKGQLENLQTAIKKISSLIAKYLGATCEIKFLDKNNYEIMLD